ncbi:riboflavin synthase [Wohlfahrtiimonas chitiniclastica]|uniref:riboflavin synthase n=1 Tax=Wohlfahrtiimonas chitiniclastica TaxID=400946 RepID=UPI0007B41F51|nr:riboflavin synthase [Wohlfahrtiimonas chitiniclastica]KZS23797.1 riboflavin synthase subunit alpha [Wohlfahrtiimonas chitiniclastica]WHR56181.1 riboflavin synthase [Wohlfahrtiimonas chitiniclastica]
MFTGIIEEVGTLQSKQQRGDVITIKVGCRAILTDVKIGDSIASNGVCLTVTKFDAQSFEADLTPESLKRSTFASLPMGSSINLERALLANSRLDGHLVSGHVDTITQLTRLQKLQNSYVLSFRLDKSDQKMVVEKGSIAINGISLTVTDVTMNAFSVSVIPHTFEITNLHNLKEGSRVNIEFDQLGKYILKEQASTLTYDKLAQWGY